MVRLANQIGIIVNAEMANIPDNAVHLGHTISSSDRKSISLIAIVVSRKAKIITSYLTLVYHTFVFSVVYLRGDPALGSG